MEKAQSKQQSVYLLRTHRLFFFFPATSTEKQASRELKGMQNAGAKGLSGVQNCHLVTTCPTCRRAKKELYQRLSPPAAGNERTGDCERCRGGLLREATQLVI